MIEADKALELVLSHPVDPGSEAIPLDHAAGRILREDLVADADFPPFDRVMMDGVALAYDALEQGIVGFTVQGVQGAGEAQTRLQDTGSCIEIMTGAMRPEGTDIVIPYEDLHIENGTAYPKQNEKGWKRWKNIHRKGADVREGDTLVRSGRVLGMAEVGVAASIGKATIEVARNMRVAVVSSGNELVDIDEKPLPHQIRKSNVYAIRAAMDSMGVQAHLYHLRDDPDSMVRILKDVLQECDVLLMSGGVSMGKYDYVPDIMKRFGIEQVFHKVNQKPGKPFWFGTAGQKTAFAFPGNPVSTMVCFYKYFVPWFRKSAGGEPSKDAYAVLQADFTNHTGKTLFVPAELSTDKRGLLMAMPRGGRGSGDHANLVHCNAFVELDRQIRQFSRGQAVPAIFFRQIQ